MDIKEWRPVAEKLFSDIRALSFEGIGVSRDSYGEKESACADYLRDFAEQAGLAVSTDRAANVLFNLPGVAGVARQGTLIGSLLKLTVKLSQENHDAIQLLSQSLEAFGDQPVSQVISLGLIGSHQRQVVNEDHSDLAAFSLDAA